MRPRDLVRTAAEQLTAAGVESPEHDAAELLAHVTGTTRAGLALVDDVDEVTRERFEGLVARRAARTPLQHAGTPDDVAHAVSYLLDARSGFVTGQVLYVCGGMTVGVAGV